MMDLKIYSSSYGYSALEIKSLLCEFAAARGKHNLDVWLDGCRFVAAEKKMSVEFAVSCEPTVADPKKLGNRITAFFRDLGDPAGPVPVCRLWRGRKADLDWITGQLVFDGNEMFILSRDANAGWCWFAVDQVEPV